MACKEWNLYDTRVPACLNRRYQALDNLVGDLTRALEHRTSDTDGQNENEEQALCEDPSIKLMCNFWNILKMNPDCDLPNVVQKHLCGEPARNTTGFVGYQNLACYMATNDRGSGSGRKHGSSGNPSNCGSTRSCCKTGIDSAASSRDAVPLSKVLCNLKEAASYDKECNLKLKDLLTTGKHLQDQIQMLEQREKDGTHMLKQADCMWACMEESYKNKIVECLEIQKTLYTQLKEVETSSNKWKKNKKELESQIRHIVKCQDEIKAKIVEKSNDIKFMDKEIQDYQKRIAANKKDTDNSHGALRKKKESADKKILGVAEEAKQLKRVLNDERLKKVEKVEQGNAFIKETREDLKKLCRVMLQRKLENEDLLAERNALVEDINTLKDTCLLCKDRCKSKQDYIREQLITVQKEIDEFKLECIKCHQCTDTSDTRRFCNECPRCLEDRECIIQEDESICTPDHNFDCVCQSVKVKFLDNVFENMYTVLEKEANTKPGKAVADAILTCLKKSKNGKLNEETRNILQEFILTTVKKNLNLTIVGGAVKTRCEMDAQTYSQLMNCLKVMKPGKVPKSDAGTTVKKDSCRRWGGPSECNCPKGPKNCICTQKAPRPPRDPSPCPPNRDDAAEAGTKVVCPHRKNATCGIDCGARKGYEEKINKQVTSWEPDACKGPSCNFQNMRFEPDPVTVPRFQRSGLSNPYDHCVLGQQITCTCGSTPTKPCTCICPEEPSRVRSRQTTIEEVLGDFFNDGLVDKVTMEEIELTESTTSRCNLFMEGVNYKNSNFACCSRDTGDLTNINKLFHPYPTENVKNIRNEERSYSITVPVSETSLKINPIGRCSEFYSQQATDKIIIRNETISDNSNRVIPNDKVRFCIRTAELLNNITDSDEPIENKKIEVKPSKESVETTNNTIQEKNSNELYFQAESFQNCADPSSNEIKINDIDRKITRLHKIYENINEIKKRIESESENESVTKL